MTEYATLVGIIRGLVQDEVPEAYRYTPAAMAQAFTMAMTEVKRARPDGFTGSRRSVTTVITEDALTGTFPLDDIFVAPVVNLVVGYLQLRDEPFVVDGQAAGLLQRGGALLTGG